METDYLKNGQQIDLHKVLQLLPEKKRFELVQPMSVYEFEYPDHNTANEARKTWNRGARHNGVTIATRILQTTLFVIVLRKPEGVQQSK